MPLQHTPLDEDAACEQPSQTIAIRGLCQPHQRATDIERQRGARVHGDERRENSAVNSEPNQHVPQLRVIDRGVCRLDIDKQNIDGLRIILAGSFTNRLDEREDRLGGAIQRSKSALTRVQRLDLLSPLLQSPINDERHDLLHHCANTQRPIVRNRMRIRALALVVHHQPRDLPCGGCHAAREDKVQQPKQLLLRALLRAAQGIRRPAIYTRALALQLRENLGELCCSKLSLQLQVVGLKLLLDQLAPCQSSGAR